MAERDGDGQRPWFPRRLAQAAAAGHAVSTVAGARRLTPWLRPAPLPEVEYPKVFVVGCPRSGTTWVADILGRHPEVIRGRESHLYPTLEHTIGEHGRNSIEAWARLYYGIDRGRRQGTQSGLHYYVDRPTFSRLARSALAAGGDDDELVDRLVRAVLDTSFSRAANPAARVLVEKTPQHLLFARRILATFPEAHLVIVVRDGRDVCVSMDMRWPIEKGWPRDRDAQIRLWMRYVVEGLALHADPALCDRVTTVRYEDMKLDPSTQTARLLERTGLALAPATVAEIVAHTDISSYPTGTGAFRFRGEVGTWAEHFTTEDTERFRSTVGDLFTELGYSY